MSETPAIDYAAIAKTLVARYTDAEFQSLQWENLANSLQAKVTELEGELADARAVSPSEAPLEGTVVTADGPVAG
jgi:hypothetical protein